MSEALSNRMQGEQSEFSAACRGKPGLKTDFHDLRIFLLLQAAGSIRDSSCTTTWWLLEPHLGWRCEVQKVKLGSKPPVNRTHASDDLWSWWTQPPFLQGQARLSETAPPITHPTRRNGHRRSNHMKSKHFSRGAAGNEMLSDPLNILNQNIIQTPNMSHVCTSLFWGAVKGG